VSTVGDLRSGEPPRQRDCRSRSRNGNPVQQAATTSCAMGGSNVESKRVRRSFTGFFWQGKMGKESWKKPMTQTSINKRMCPGRRTGAPQRNGLGLNRRRLTLQGQEKSTRKKKRRSRAPGLSSHSRGMLVRLLHSAHIIFSCVEDAISRK